MNDLVPAVVGGAIAIVAGAIGLLGRQLFDRRTASHEARRALYVELLTALIGRREYLREASRSPDATLADLPTEQLDRMSALLSIDATDAVTAKADVCFELLNRFRVSWQMNVPVEVDEHDRYRYRNDLVAADQPQPVRDQTMRMALGDIADEFSAAVSELAAQVKREVHRTL